jgi:hypothetical protein
MISVSDVWREHHVPTVGSHPYSIKEPHPVDLNGFDAEPSRTPTTLVARPPSTIIATATCVIKTLPYFEENNRTSAPTHHVDSYLSATLSGLTEILADLPIDLANDTLRIVPRNPIVWTVPIVRRLFGS